MQLALKTWCLVTCLFLFLSSAVVNASESPCPDNLLPPPEKISAKDHNLIESILDDLNDENFTPLKKHIRRNLRLLRRYHHLMAKDQDLARKILRFVEFSPHGSDAIEDLATARQYYTLLSDITLQNITPLVIKPGKVTAKNHYGFTIDLEYLGVELPNSDEVKVYSAEERLLNVIFSSSEDKDVSSRYKRWLALLENEQEQYLKFDGKKFYLDKSKNGAITAKKFEQQLKRQRELKRAFKQLKEDIPFFFRSNREIGNLFAQQKSFRDLGQLWEKFNHLAHKLSNNETLIKLINHELTNENSSLPDELKSHLKRYKIEALSTKVFVQRRARIYNLYLKAIRNRISKILSDLITDAEMDYSVEEIYLSSSNASREIRDILHHYKGSIVENNDQRRPFSISTLELKFEAESIPGMRFSGNIEKWREVIWHAKGEYLPLGPDHLYLLQILKLVIETFDRNQSLEHLTLTINDPNDVIINDARMGKFATQKDCGGWAYGGYNSWGAHPGNGLVVIGADNFCNRKVFSLSALVHELHHTITRNNGLYLFPSTTRIEGPLYANQFAISEITARLAELEHLRKQFEILIQVLHHPENDSKLTDDEKILFYSLLQDHTKNDSHDTKEDLHQIKRDIISEANSALRWGFKLAEQAQETLTSAKQYFDKPAQPGLKFILEERHKKTIMINQANHENSGRSGDWSQPSSDNENFLKLYIDIPKIGELDTVIPLNTAINPDVLQNTALINYLKNPSKETLQAFLKNQVGQWASQVEGWIKDLKKYEIEFTKLRGQI